MRGPAAVATIGPKGTVWLDWAGIVADPAARREMVRIVGKLPGIIHVQRDVLPAVARAAGEPGSPLHRYRRWPPHPWG